MTMVDWDAFNELYNYDEEESFSHGGNGTDNVDDRILNLRLNSNRMSIQTEQLINDIILHDEQEQAAAAASADAALAYTSTIASTSVPPDLSNNNSFDKITTTETLFGRNFNNTSITAFDDDCKQQRRRRPSVQIVSAPPQQQNYPYYQQQQQGLTLPDESESDASVVLSLRPSSMSDETAAKVIDALSGLNQSELDYLVGGEPEKGGVRGGGGDASPVTATPLPLPQKKRACRVYSISQDTLRLFDDGMCIDNDDDDGDDDYPANNKKEEETVIIKSVEIVSKETIDSTFCPTHEEYKQQQDALEAEFSKLSVVDQGKIMFELHGFDDMNDNSNSISSGHGNGNGNGTTKTAREAMEIQKEQNYLRRFDDELNTKLTWLTSLPSSSSLFNNNTVDENNGNTTGTATMLLHESDKNFQDFLEVQQLYPSYVNSNEFRLRFARPWSIQQDKIAAISATATANVVKQNQQKERLGILNHFYVKKELFGGTDYDDAMLGRDIRISDLTHDDREALESGYYQIMPNRDVAGRLVGVYAGHMKQYKHINNHLRANFYLSTVCSKDIETSRTGIVTIQHRGGQNYPSYNIHQRKHNNYTSKYMENAKRYAEAFFPPPVKAIHFCYSDLYWKPIITAILVHMCRQEERVRTREHYSKNHDEICFQLETFGIPIDREIFLPDGFLGLHWHKEWLLAQQAIEEEEMETEQLMTINNESISTNDAINTTSNGNDVYRQFSNIVIIPTNSDILFAGSGNGGRDCGGIRVGKGNIYNHRKHPGNLRWAILLEKYYEQYKAIPKQEFGKKTELSEIVVESVQKNDGRFLKRDPKKGWQEMDHEQVLDKVVHFFQGMRSKEESALSPSSSLPLSSSSTGVRVYKEPMKNDVLFGRGGKSNNHPGNATYRCIVEQFEKSYKSCTNREEKNRVIEKVMKQIESCGGNFLKRDKTFGWHIEDESIVYQKVNQALRDERDPKKRKLKRERYLANRKSSC